MKKEKTKIYYDEFGDLLEIVIGKPTEAYFESIGDEIFMRIDEKIGKVSGFMVVAFKKRLEKNLHVCYNRAKDILEVAIRMPIKEGYEEIGDQIFIHRDEGNMKIIGFKIHAFKKRLIKLNFHEAPLEEPPLSL